MCYKGALGSKAVETCSVLVAFLVPRINRTHSLPTDLQSILFPTDKTNGAQTSGATLNRGGGGGGGEREVTFLML